MNPEELAKQIRKFKSRQIKTRLAYYGTLLSLFLALSAFGRGATISSLISFLLILPLPLYFFLQSLKLYRKNKTRMIPLSGIISGLSSRFSFGKFISQPGFAFRLSLVLFFLVIFTTLARTSSAQAVSEGGSVPHHLSATN